MNEKTVPLGKAWHVQLLLIVEVYRQMAQQSVDPERVTVWMIKGRNFPHFRSYFIEATDPADEQTTQILEAIAATHRSLFVKEVLGPVRYSPRWEILNGLPEEIKVKKIIEINQSRRTASQGSLF